MAMGLKQIQKLIGILMTNRLKLITSCFSLFFIKGTIQSQLSRRKGIITSMDASEGWCSVYAEVPLNEMFGFSMDLRSATQGKGEYAMEYSRYTPCLPEVQEKLITDYQIAQGIHQEKKN